MDALFQTYHRLLRADKPSYYRQFYRDFDLSHRLMGVIGARGVGKTTFLLQYLRDHYGESEKALYFSADNLYFTEHSLLETANQFVQHHGGELLCIDEIHKYKNWNQELKNIYDSYPRLSVLFSGSSSIDLIHGKYDLSRRMLLRPMHGFSFREYLEIRTGQTLPVLTLAQLVDPEQRVSPSISGTEKLLGHMREYWRRGYYPTAEALPTEEDFWESLIGIVDKTIFDDVSAFYNLKTGNLDVLRKILYFFATSLPGSVSINNLAGSLGKDHSTIAEYIQILRDTGLLRFLLVDKLGHALVRNAEKVYLDNTNILYAVNSVIGQTPGLGSVRELFVIQALENAGYVPLYTKSGDVVCEGYTFEIGGAGKGRKQIREIAQAFVVKDDVLFPTRGVIPLYLFGFLS